MFSEIKPKLYAWAQACLPDYDIAWSQQNMPTLVAPFAVLQIDKLELQGESVDLTPNPDAVDGEGEDLIETSTAVLRFELSISVYGTDHASAHAASVPSVQLRSAFDSTQELLLPLACTGISGVANVSQFLDDAGTESRAELTATFYARHQIQGVLPAIDTVITELEGVL